MSLPPLVTADGTKGSTWPKAINPWAGGGLCLVLIRKDGVTKQIPPRNVNIRCPEAEQLASAVETERIQRDKVKITSTRKASWSDEGKRNDEQERKKPGNAERRGEQKCRDGEDSLEHLAQFPWGPVIPRTPHVTIIFASLRSQSLYLSKWLSLLSSRTPIRTHHSLNINCLMLLLIWFPLPVVSSTKTQIPSIEILPILINDAPLTVTTGNNSSLPPLCFHKMILIRHVNLKYIYNLYFLKIVTSFRAQTKYKHFWPAWCLTQ